MPRRLDPKKLADYRASRTNQQPNGVHDADVPSVLDDLGAKVFLKEQFGERVHNYHDIRRALDRIGYSQFYDKILDGVAAIRDEKTCQSYVGQSAVLEAAQSEGVPIRPLEAALMNSL